ncbi:hypothetical protein Dform_00963 [Dehalogenimonas formicexedens]|uniref:Uncharacterized protein n=1 Tax=Dehalogenimonas formicexedens TaxID=1839801 RepID=A0A1P8F758_9CHLR|nr:hypothetical protein Dform_00963 [Dehalogenimonas formicexedens]
MLSVIILLIPISRGCSGLEFMPEPGAGEQPLARTPNPTPFASEFYSRIITKDLSFISSSTRERRKTFLICYSESQYYRRKIWELLFRGMHGFEGNTEILRYAQKDKEAYGIEEN